ncbi:hypothetical protein ACLB2K_040967 [Fragaria x ananassa]
MKVLAAYMLARLGGNTNPSADDLKTILGAVGAEIDGHRIELFLSEVNEKNIDELVASGKEKLASVPSVGDTSAAAPLAVVQETKEEKVEEEEEDDGPDIFDLFGPDNYFLSIWDNGSISPFVFKVRWCLLDILKKSFFGEHASNGRGKPLTVGFETEVMEIAMGQP